MKIIFFNGPNFPAVLEVREWFLRGERMVMTGRGTREPAGEGSVLSPGVGGYRVTKLLASASCTKKVNEKPMR